MVLISDDESTNDDNIQPPSLKAIEANCKQIVLGIDFDQPFIQFQVKSKEMGYVNQFTKAENVMDTTYYANGLHPNRTFFFKCRAQLNNRRYTKWSDEISVRTTKSKSFHSIPTNSPIEGEFKLILEPLEQVQNRKERAKSLAGKLIELWVREDAKLAEDPHLKDAANTFSRLFLGEAVRYVDIHAPPHNRLACFEHARIVREWYEIRMRLNPNLPHHQ